MVADMSELRDEIIKARKLVVDLEKQYCNETPKCTNCSCGLFNIGYPNNCSWSVLTEECKDYTTE